MNIKRYDVDSVNAIYNSFFDAIQNAIKDMLLKKPYNISPENVENFNNKLVKQNDSNENTIRNLVSDSLERKLTAEDVAKKILDLYFTKTKINHFNQDNIQDVPSVLGETTILKYNDFINENTNNDILSNEKDIEFDIEFRLNYRGDFFTYNFFISNSYNKRSQDIINSLTKQFKDNNLNNQKALTYIAYILDSNYDYLYRNYNIYVDVIDTDDIIISLNDYSTIENFNKFYDLLKLENLSNLDSFINNEYENYGTDIISNKFLSILLKYCTKGYQVKMNHLFNAKKFDLL